MRTPFFTIRTGILDYLRGGFPWPARSFKHMESISIYIYINIHSNIVFHTTSGALWSGPPSAYLNVVTRMQTHRNQQ